MRLFPGTFQCDGCLESGTGAVCRVHVGSEAIGTHPLTALEFGLIAEPAGLHAGVLNIVTGFGSEAGQPLTEHPDVDKLAITGSVPAGIRIMATEAKDIKTISFELDGKSPMVVFADTPIEEAVEWIMFGIFLNQGEVCLATSRVLIEEEIYEPLLARLNEESEKIRIGHGLGRRGSSGSTGQPVATRKGLFSLRTRQNRRCHRLIGWRCPGRPGARLQCPANQFGRCTTGWVGVERGNIRPCHVFSPLQDRRRKYRAGPHIPV